MIPLIYGIGVVVTFIVLARLLNDRQDPVGAGLLCAIGAVAWPAVIVALTLVTVGALAMTGLAWLVSALYRLAIR